MTTLEATVDFKIFIRAWRSHVFEALTNSWVLSEWFATQAEVEPFAGGQLNFRWVDWGNVRNGTNGGIVVVFQPPQRFSFRWNPGSGGYFTTVDIHLRFLPEGTLIVLREYGFEDSPAGLQDMVSRAGDWGESLTLLKFFLEGTSTKQVSNHETYSF